MPTFIQNIYKILLDSLFPISSAEKEALSYSPEYAYKTLPKSPTSPIPLTYSIFAYKDERVKKLIWNIKNKKSPEAIAIGGYALLQALTDIKYLSDSLIIIPIPLTDKRRRERGFNQIEILSDEIQRLSPNIVVEKNLLIRAHHSSEQKTKDRRERLVSTKGIFSISSNFPNIPNLPNQNSIFIIIDDVITTGSTMKSAMETLKKSGLNKVYGLSLAH